ncbi:MAG: Rrf2 family transcriptional regulator [Clostridia bacterium]|nr:Rrf2 family transcriptional regulator [Clostridia bacterium]
MRITQESDYALRILTHLAAIDGVADAQSISEHTSVTPRFTLKILHKLVSSRYVTSYKGARGGYRLAVSPDEITLKAIIELIDGPIAMMRCLEKEQTCSLNSDKTACIYHHIFESISMDVARKLQAITISDVLNRPSVFESL